MQFHLGAIPEAPEFIPDSSWRSLREPSPWLMQVFAIPVALVTAVVFIFLWIVLTPVEEARFDLSLPPFLLSFAGIIVVHEFIHAFVHPGAGRSQESVLGFWPSRMLFYAAYTGELTRNRFIAILLMPLVVISVAPLLVAAVFQIPTGWTAFVSILNALLACGDILGAGLILCQIPGNAIVRNQGWRSYWRTDATTAGNA